MSRVRNINGLWRRHNVTSWGEPDNYGLILTEGNKLHEGNCTEVNRVFVLALKCVCFMPVCVCVCVSVCLSVCLSYV